MPLLRLQLVVAPIRPQLLDRLLGVHDQLVCQLGRRSIDGRGHRRLLALREHEHGQTAENSHCSLCRVGRQRNVTGLTARIHAGCAGVNAPSDWLPLALRLLENFLHRRWPPRSWPSRPRHPRRPLLWHQRLPGPAPRARWHHGPHWHLRAKGQRDWSSRPRSGRAVFWHRTQTSRIGHWRHA